MTHLKVVAAEISRVVILSQKNLEKPSHNDTEGFEITFTGGFNTEFITENKALEL